MLYDLRVQRPPPPQFFTRLRAVDALAFEELVLDAFHGMGAKVKRSSRYSGDGGSDGEIRLNGKWYLCQMKRYKGAIKPVHIADFNKLCRQRKLSGFFIHTGRTGPVSKEMFDKFDLLTCISGRDLYHFLVDGEIEH